MAEKVLTYEEFTENSEATPETIAAYHEYLRSHPDAKNQFLNNNKNGK